MNKNKSNCDITATPYSIPGPKRVTTTITAAN
jgi:hypothetical protein